jgi:hypothetical protein
MSSLFASLNNKEGAHVNVHPFWVCPRNLFWHNMFIASQSRTVDSGTVWANILGNMALVTLSMQANKLNYYLGGQLGAWLIWLYAPGSRAYLTSPELQDVIDMPPPSQIFQ